MIKNCLRLLPPRLVPLKQCAFSSLPNFKEIEIIHSSIQNIHFNLATEEYLFDFCTLSHPILFMWRNDKTVVIGRHQNPFKECNLQNMEEDGVVLARRRSGGGAVYHNLGNTCFSFLIPVFGEEPPLNAKTTNNEILLKGLSQLNLKAEVSGRNDILIDGKKISGSAYQINLGKKDGSGKRCLHHGTMLINIDPTIIQKYLNPNKEKLKSKGVDSVVSRVTNLCQYDKEMNHEKLSTAFEKAFADYYSSCKLINTNYDYKVLEKIPKINELYNELKSHSWLYQSTPKFTNNIETRFDWGVVDVYLHVEKCMIKESKVYSDCLFPDYIESMNNTLNSGEFSYDSAGIKKFCQVLSEKNPKHSDFTRQMEEWLLKKI